MQPEATEETLPPGEVAAEVAIGCNKYMYYVCQVLGGPFTLLDDVTPAQIRGARKICKLLTGNLAASVPSCPPFPGTERQFLRAQIARIGHATTLCPKGCFVPPEEDEGEITENEEYKPLAPARMQSPASWCHRCQPPLVPCSTLQGVCIQKKSEALLTPVRY
jgi:radial spoke head protein 4A